MIENDFTSIFGETPIWHLCTDGETQCLIFRDKEDLKEGMNLVGLSLAKFRSRISSLTFSLMNNHMHFLIQGEKEDIETFFNYLYGKIRRMLLRQNRGSDMPKPKYSLMQITSDNQYTPKLCYEVGSDHTVLSMVECGLGMTITHSLIAHNPRYHVVCKRFDVEQYRDIAIATANNVHVASTTKLFVDHVIARINEMPF